jgi:mono/diheme cytochrome c family protein
MAGKQSNLANLLRVHVPLVAVALLLAQAVCADSPESLVERGEYLARAGNCASCHTTADGQQLAGGVAFETPFGKIYSTNITPDAETGIGKWSLDQFLRKGVRPDGEHLYPVFPYTSFTKVTDADGAALYAYLKTVPAANATPPQNELSFPFNQRSLMFVWKSLFFIEGAYQADATKSAEWNRGAYLVEGLAHCSACHSPRNSLGAERSGMALTGGVYTDKVPGGALHEWSAPNLTSAPNGLGAWPVEELTAYLKTGKNSFVATWGPMNEVILNSTQHLSAADVRAMAAYLKNLPPNAGDVGSAASDEVVQAGSTLYDVHCGTCHLPTGLGGPDTGPRLAGVPVVQSGNPASLINVILYGPEVVEPATSTTQEASTASHWKEMEPFADKLDDEEVAALASYLRSAWGNKAGAVTAEQVAKQR